MPDFFLDAEGGKFAFLKESDQADWSGSVYRNQDALVSPPSDDSHQDVLECSQVRRVVLLLKPDGDVENYEFIIHGWENAREIEGFYPLEGGEFSGGYTRNKAVLIKVQGVDAIYPEVTALDGEGSIELEYAPVPYEE